MLPTIFRKKAEAITQAIPIGFKTFNTQLANKIHEDPFFKENISSVQIEYYPTRTYNLPFLADGTIRFKAGDTSGSQSFKGQTIEEVLEQMAAFIKTL